MNNRFFSVAWASSAVALIASVVPIRTKATPNAFIQDIGPDGLLAIEAEHFNTNTPGEVHTWTLITNSLAANSNAMQAVPDVGTNFDSGYTAVSPRLDFNVIFTNSGTHYVWVRYYAMDLGSDSVHVGLDGAATATSDRMGSGVTNQWDWMNVRTNGTIATINVTIPGLHTLNVWMREDGFAFDKLLLTTNLSYQPAGTGPPESPTQPLSNGPGVRRVPSLSELLAATQSLNPGDVPEDNFLPPTNAVLVATTGNDSNAGTLSAPFLTIERAIEYSRTNSAPLTIYIRAGDYVYKGLTAFRTQQVSRGNVYVTAFANEVVTIRPFTWPGNPTDEYSQFAFEVRGPFTNITFDNLGFAGWQVLFALGSDRPGPALQNVTLKNIRGAQLKHRDGSLDNRRGLVRTDDITAQFSPGNFVNPETNSYQLENLIISKVSLTDVDTAVDFAFESAANVKGARISELDVENPFPTVTTNTVNDLLALVNSYKILIDDCTLTGSAGDGIDAKSYNVAVVNCFIKWINLNALKFWYTQYDVINSIIYASTGEDDGVLVVQRPSLCRLVHSELYFKTFKGYAGTLFGTGSNVQFINCIFSDLPNNFLIETTNFISRNCLYNMTNGLITSGGVGFPDIATVAQLNQLPGCSENISNFPSLTNPPGNDFTPAAGSPCIDHGTTNGLRLPTFDFYGRARLFGAAPDIGAVEYGSIVPFRLDILSATPPGSIFMISWFGDFFHHYDLLTSTNLLNWVVVPGYSNVAGMGSVLSYTNQSVGASAFYRGVARTD